MGERKGFTKEIVFLFMAALLITCLFRSKVNNFVKAILPEKEVILTIENPEFSISDHTQVSILCEGSQNELFLLCKDAAQEPWVYVEGKVGETWTSLTNREVGSTITFKAKALPNTYLVFLGNRAGGAVSIMVRGGVKQTVDTYSEAEHGEIIRVYPFAESRIKLVLQLVCYLFLFILISVVLLFINYFLKRKRIRIPLFLKREVVWKDIFWLWICLYGIAVVKYKVIGIPNYLEIGDESAYWNTLLLYNGKFDIGYLARLFTPRGYWCYVFQTISRAIGEYLHIDGILVWLLFPAFFISWLSVFILPKFYGIFTEKKASIFQMSTFLLGFLYIWFAALTCVMMDIFGLVTLFAGILYALCFFKEKKVVQAVLAGVFAAMACSFRVAYQYAFYTIIVLFIVYGIVNIWNSKKLQNRKQFWLGIIIGLFAFLIVCMPQFLINQERGHFGFLPYDHDNAWAGRSLIEWGADTSLTYGSIGYPIGGLSDSQITTMKPMLYRVSEELNLIQLMDVFAESPIDTLMFIFKKLLMGFDIKTNIGYPNGVYWRASSGILFSFINYFILLSGLYVLCFSDKVKKQERWAVAFVFLTLVLPETFTKIEWRYIFPGYLVLHYIFAYHFIGECMLDIKEYKKLMEKSNYLPFIVVSIFLMFCFSFSFCA